MQKLLNLARRIAPTIKSSTSATGVYYYIKNDKFLKPIEKALNAKEIIQNGKCGTGKTEYPHQLFN